MTACAVFTFINEGKQIVIEKIIMNRTRKNLCPSVEWYHNFILLYKM